jgi:heat-inducible transcriptional repressor
MITGTKKVRSEQIKTDYFLTEQALATIKQILNENLTGLSIDRVTMPLIMKMEKEAGYLAPIINPIIRVVFKCTKAENDGTIKIDDLSNLLSYPEFSDVEKLKSIMDVFDKRKGYIKNLLTSPETITDDNGDRSGLVPLEAGSGMKVYIGDEDEASALSDTSLVFCTLPTDAGESVIGILGPKRMDYRKVVSTLRQFSESLGRAMEKDTKKHSTEDIDE